MTNILGIRSIFFLFAIFVGYLTSPADQKFTGTALGASLGMLGIALEIWLRLASSKAVWGGMIGFIFSLAGLWFLSPYLISLNHPLIIASAALLLIYLGLTVGSAKLDIPRFSSLPAAPPASHEDSRVKILDTSVIIDGRIADIIETGFLSGPIMIPQFVLRELQLVADSSDSLKRNRGRRGLDILQKLQKNPKSLIEINEDDFAQVREVDMKLIELAKAYHGQIVTNDFNLNKVAQLRGIQVLNINELANALRPVVLPGEIMRVFILKEGKEHTQGVAYLDDGTMVVVEGARRMISKTIDITVTSVLQTTAGKMIFGRYDERHHVVHERPEQKLDRQAQPVSPPSI